MPAGVFIRAAGCRERKLGAVMQLIKDATEMFDPAEVEKRSAVGFKNREKLILMPIEDFLKMALDETADPSKAAIVSRLVDDGVKFSDLPFLLARTEDVHSQRVYGHEGRHRARVLASMGYTHMPVILKQSMRWSEQANPARIDYVEQWPTRLIGETGEDIPFPVSREMAMANFRETGNPAKVNMEQAAAEITETQAFRFAESILPGEVPGLLRHEGLHFLARHDRKFQARFRELASQFEAARPHDARVRAAFKRVPVGTRPQVVTEEAMAYFVADAGNRASSLCRRIVAAVKAWLYRCGVPIKTWRIDDLHALTVQCLRGYSSAGNGLSFDLSARPKDPASVLEDFSTYRKALALRTPGARSTAFSPRLDSEGLDRGHAPVRPQPQASL